MYIKEYCVPDTTSRTLCKSSCLSLRTNYKVNASTSPTYRWRKQHLERLNNLPRITEQERGTSELTPDPIKLQNACVPSLGYAAWAGGWFARNFDGKRLLRAKCQAFFIYALT